MKKILYWKIIAVLLLFGLVVVSCKENPVDNDSEPEPPPYNASAWLGTWQGEINGGPTRITFTASGLTESWPTWLFPGFSDSYNNSYTTRFDTIIPWWNYRNDSKSDYPSGYIFNGTITASTVDGDKGYMSRHELFLNKNNNNNMMIVLGDIYGFFVKQ